MIITSIRLLEIEVEISVALISNLHTGVCFAGTELSTASDFHCGAKTAPHTIIC